MSWKTLSLQRKKTSSPALQRNQMSYKRGDMERANLMNLVKEGKMSVDAAMQKAYGMGVASVPYEELGNENMSLGEQYNFGVIWYSRSNKSTKCILHIDTGNRFISLLHRGQELIKFNFTNLSHIDNTDDSSRLFISLNDMTTYEIDVSTIEEKNRVARILMSILEQHQSGAVDLNIRTDSFKERRELVIKEGVLEKKGRSAAFLIWPKRYVKVVQGEVMYFKVGEEDNENSALSILSLSNSNTSIKKIDNNAFVLNVAKKEYIFRVFSNVKDVNVEKERDDWILAIQMAMGVSHEADKILQPLSNNIDQEMYLKSVVRSLNDELEQLSAVLSVIDAPIRASTQVRRVREIVHSLNDQIHTGLLSWTLRSATQNKVDNSNSSIYESLPENETNAVKFISAVGSNPSIQQGGLEGKERNNNYYHLNNIIVKNRSNSYNNSLQENETQNQTVKNIDSDYELSSNFVKNQGEQTYVMATYTARESEQEKSNITEYAPINKPGIKKQEVYVNISSDHFATTHIKPDLPPPINENSFDDGFKNSFDDGFKKQESSEKSENNFKEFSSSSYEAVEVSFPEKSEISKPDDNSTESKIDIQDKKEVTSPISEITYEATESFHPASNVPLPPPLPANLTVNLPERNFLESKCNMKPLFWSKVPDFNINASAWKNAIDRSEQLDLEKLESLFYVGQQKSLSVDNLDKIGTANDKPKEKKSFLNSKKAQNIGIFLNGFKLSVNDLDLKLNKVLSGLSTDEIIALKRFQPTAEEIELFKSIDYKEFNLDTDKFMHKLCSVENLNERLDILLTIHELPEVYDNVSVPMRNIFNVITFLKDNKDLFRLLEYVLAAGNYLNSGSNRGCAYGFRLASLKKLSEVLSYNKKVSFLDFIVEELYNNDKKAITCCIQVKTFIDNLDISVKGICAEAEIMNKDIERLEKSVMKIQSKLSEDFNLDVKKFIDKYKGLTQDLKDESNTIQKSIIDVLRYFGESTSTDFDEWYKVIIKFINNINRIVSNIENEAERKAQRNIISSLPNKGKNESLPTKTTSYMKSIDYKSSDSKDYKPSDSYDYKSKSLPLNVSASYLMSHQADSTNENLPTRSGYLMQYKKNKSKWLKKYFEITEAGYLQYSKKEESKSSKNIYLRGTKISIDPSEHTLIIIQSQNDVFKIKAENNLEALDWVNDLKHYC